VAMFKEGKNEDIIEIRLYDGFFTNYQGRARVKNRKELAQLRDDLEAKGLDTKNLFI